MKKVICLILIVGVTFSIFVFNSTSANNYLFGDVNDDGHIDTKDVLSLRKYLAKIDENINKQNANTKYDFDDEGEPYISGIDASFLRQYLAKRRSSLTPEEYTTINEYNLTNKYTIDKLSNCMYVCGRGELSGNELLMDQTASGLVFKANCEGDLRLTIKSNNGGYVDVIVDEDYDSIHRLRLVDGSATRDYYLKLDMKQAEHTLRILKATEWSQNAFVLKNITVSGTLATTKPAEKNLKLEFYGDSITAGYGNLCDGGTNKGNWAYQDGCLTYASFCSYALNADFAVAAASGHGVLGGYGFGNRTQTYDKFFDYKNVSKKTEWSRKNYNADVIILNYGSNDDARYGEGDIFDGKDYEAKCGEIVEKMHSDNPNAKIVWIIGMNYVSNTSVVLTSLQNIAQKYDYVYFKKFTARQDGGDWHPSIANHKTAASELVQFLKDKVL